MSEQIGISNLPNQRYKLASKNGGYFTLMVAGESGLGKTTFINTLFQTTLKQSPDAKVRHKSDIHKTVEIEITRAELEEKNYTLRLNVIDTPGFGDNINNRNAFQPIVDFIDDQHDLYMKQEQQPERARAHDLRVHACLYFIRPTGHTLKPLDVEVMKKLGSRCNLIPVIAKADTLSPNEMLDFKNNIRAIIEAQDIRIYSPPIDHEDQGAAEHARQLIESMPFAVIGSEDLHEVTPGAAPVAGRKYPWGIVEVENDQHCDFRKLRSLLLRINMLDLILSTEELHYETYRSLRLSDDVPERSHEISRINNPKFLEEEKALRQAFSNQVKVEEQRFKQWEQNINTERARLNHDLSEIQEQIKQMEDQIKKLEISKGIKV
ncbi:Component of the septin ring, required for cytokinesis [Komagataella phaffii CBS 7435]|uniref:Component of the septin ring of the mother-bud neck that is required for cytokinesis n=2 Tax=Komagataella phaffii TaxID=460519 RepID=C4R7F5_KOMPG|nr:Component of the septin ring of the mother-bud neck that is required for cytokinesis [Komagataella phaffii GS115]AOA64838.1 GQ67_04624T0 [Komagataella phaffii]CAH2451096.1 Component of the septin ring, required for cytokinesis [Komagataella phaffii CBS 7435]AOA69651.1 GQ68_04596T0 [Komagataella phaffii GS115]CAY71530.1 Component of the septin ring of the mother-bud neck that is required for cytokinesis [Komagataella phaffii GS115]CCA40863.1 Component of the septin ring, required for cytokin